MPDTFLFFMFIKKNYLHLVSKDEQILVSVQFQNSRKTVICEEQIQGRKKTLVR